MEYEELIRERQILLDEVTKEREYNRIYGRVISESVLERLSKIWEIDKKIRRLGSMEKV